MTKKEFVQQKICGLDALKRKVQSWRLRSEKVVFTNGCFDLLHLGHLDVLLRAAQFGDRLIVGVNSDASVKDLKGSKRPINSEQERTFMLAALHFVDVVILFEATTPLALIEAISPDVLVKGGDYTAEEVVGADWVKKQGGNIVIVPLLSGFSTTATIDKIKSLGN